MIILTLISFPKDGLFYVFFLIISWFVIKLWKASIIIYPSNIFMFMIVIIQMVWE